MYVLEIAYIILGKQLVKKIDVLCQRCRYIKKKTTDVEMEPVSQHRFKITTPFYVTQTDMLAFSKHIHLTSNVHQLRNT